MNNHKVQEDKILREAINVFYQETLGRIVIHPIHPPSTVGKFTPDALVSISLHNSEIQDLFVEIKGELNPHIAYQVLHNLGKEPTKWLLVARYIPNDVKELFKTNNINYIELTGNMYINIKGVYIYITGRNSSKARVTTLGKLWKPAGLKFLLAIISNPNRINDSYRDIASSAGIALGNISTLMGELKDEKFIESNDEGKYQIINKKTLINRWVELYHAIMKPKLYSGTYRFLNLDVQMKWSTIENAEIYWGGEPGADIITNNLTPNDFTFFTSLNGNELVKKLLIIPDKNGNVKSYNKFWGDITTEKIRPSKETDALSAPPLLIYADLIHSLDSRNQELANTIKEKYLL
ncbi:hypothetical protein LX64_04571 [Chitinophaga skermanii]|uniref:Transcriptional regulator with AbiEi antitoxin domain of type IV toxin-antitoxin system n=1 Tax=Chitinophaga skermanii TaxID=331697 RepID=A0A327Q6K9_9BACT|nr:type IV toxin-antitoxin system AbiEi family antitoxin [Chitinophaga skermanii]RAI99437.1 hypothetical protein LX64_04571 [Chitinophaga skermanii]